MRRVYTRRDHTRDNCIQDAGKIFMIKHTAGWSSLAARWAHNPKVVGSNPTPATK